MSDSNSATALRGYINRIEKLDDDRREVSEQIRDVLKEAKAEGFDVKAIREVLRVRRINPAERRALEEMRALYLGQLEGTPLGDYAGRQGEA